MTLATESTQTIAPPIFNHPEVIAALQQLNTIDSIKLYLQEITEDKSTNSITPISKDVRAAVKAGLIETPDHLLVSYQGRDYQGRKQESQDLAQKPVYVGLAFLWGLSSSLSAAAAEKGTKRNGSSQAKPAAVDAPPREQKPLDAVELHQLAVRYIHEPIDADEHAWERKAIAACFLMGRRIVEVLEISSFSAAGLYLMDLRDVAKNRGKAAKRGIIPVLYDADLLAEAVREIRSYLAKHRTEAMQKYHEAGGRKNPVAVRQLSSNVGGSVRRSHDKEARKLLEGCAEQENKEALHGLRRAYASIMLTSRGMLSNVSVKQQIEFVQNQLMHDDADTTVNYLEFIPTRVDELLAKLGKPFKMEMEFGVKRHVSIHARKFMFEVLLSALNNDDDAQYFREVLESSAADSGSFEVNLARKINAATEKRAEQIEQQKPKMSGHDRARLIIDCVMDWNERQQNCVPDRSAYISGSIIRWISAKHSTGITPPIIKSVLEEYAEALKTHHEGLGLGRETNENLKGKMDALVDCIVQEYADRL